MVYLCHTLNANHGSILHALEKFVPPDHKQSVSLSAKYFPCLALRHD